MKIAGIDFSINSAGICIFENNKHTFYCLHRKEYSKPRTKLLQQTSINLIKHPNDVQRNTEISKIHDAIITKDLIYDIIKDCDYIGIEGFAFAGKSNRVAELSGYQYLLRQEIYANNPNLFIYPPTTIKLFAGKGNLSKEDMISLFEKTNCSLAKEIKKLQIRFKPIDDLVDAYFVCEKVKSEI